MTSLFREAERNRILVNRVESLDPFRKCFKCNEVIRVAGRACERASKTLKKPLVKHRFRIDRGAVCKGDLLHFDRQIRCFFAQVTGNPIRYKFLNTVHVNFDHPSSGYHHGTP